MISYAKKWITNSILTLFNGLESERIGTIGKLTEGGYISTAKENLISVDIIADLIYKTNHCKFVVLDEVELLKRLNGLLLKNYKIFSTPIPACNYIAQAFPYDNSCLQGDIDLITNRN